MVEQGKDSVLRQVTQSTGFEEKRKTARLDIPLRVEYLLKSSRKDLACGDQEEIRASTKDVSVGGCLLVVREELPLESQVEIKLFLGESETEALILNGRVVRLNQVIKDQIDYFEYGIAFNEMSTEARRLFADFCFAKMYEMIGLAHWPTERKQK